MPSFVLLNQNITLPILKIKSAQMAQAVSIWVQTLPKMVYFSFKSSLEHEHTKHIVFCSLLSYGK